MSVLNSTNTITVPVTTDWVALSKTLAIEVVFIASSVSALFFHGGMDALTLAFATAGWLGLLRVSDTIANAVNVRAVVGSPVAQKAGILPQAPGTTLTTVKNGTSEGTTNAGTATT